MASNLFQRNPSKVWWAEEVEDSSPSKWRNRIENGSPSSHKSQDSGFSDSEISPTLAVTVIQKDIIKEEYSTPKTTLKKENLTENIKEKYSLKKTLTKYLTEENLQKKFDKTNAHFRSLPSTPKNYFRKNIKSETKEISNKTEKISHRVNKNLMNYFPKETSINVYSKTFPEISDNQNKVFFHKTVPFLGENDISYEDESFSCFAKNDSVEDTISSCSSLANEDLTSESFIYQNDYSDCEKEIESIFLENFEFPAHTSTPKVKTRLPSLRKNILRQKKFAEEESIENLFEINPLTLTQYPPVKCWLSEIEKLYEPECMTTLQSKSIISDLNQKVADLAEKLTFNIRQMLLLSKIILKEFMKIRTQIQKNKLNHIGPLTQSLVGNLTEFVLKYMVHSQGRSIIKIEESKNEMHNLLDISNNLRQKTMETNIDVQTTYALLVNLHDLFLNTKKNILCHQIQLLLMHIESPLNDLQLRASLLSLTSLSIDFGENFSELIIKEGGPRSLLILCMDCKLSSVRTMALRTLATVCTGVQAIRQIEEADVVEILSEILTDSSRPEPEISEAISVLAQITAPWIEDNQSVRGLTENIASIVAGITNFLVKTNCCQNLLLCAAALANITYMNCNSGNEVVRCNSVGQLLQAVRKRGPKASIFVKEQTSIIIANLSDIPEYRHYLAKNQVAVALLHFLQIYPINFENEIELNASQRLQQKSAIALSRLCSDAKVSEEIVELNGITRLVQLCKDPKERHYSDAVLVACLATLRKIVANCGNNVIDQKDYIELVEPRLLDSFLAYSAEQNESYV